ncbi:unnamed protein product [Caenorhabditis angaria]|uniref:Uncharacterized protein n=1 Tax=Caenorhabditis angaria TaxID=860376 RepID=A0A9P1I6Z2_9PELO|nr:unnamed protein product [Caenorhabditis angaria]
MGIAIFIAFALLIIAILSLIGISLFSYDCEMKTPSQNSDKNFYTFDGKAVNIGKITGGCEKGSSIYTKMDANLNRNIIVKSLDDYQNNVENLTSTLHHMSANLNRTDIMAKYAELQTQIFVFSQIPTATCLIKQDKTTLNETISLFETLKSDFEKFQKIDERNVNKDMRPEAKKMVQHSFESMKNDSVKLVGSINSQLTKTDIKCYQEMPHGLCDEKAIYSRNVIIVNWILFGVYVLLAILAKLLYVLPFKRMHSGIKPEEEIDYLKGRVGQQNKEIIRKNKNEIWYGRRYLHHQDKIKSLKDKVKGKEKKKKEVAPEESEKTPTQKYLYSMEGGVKPEGMIEI